MTTLIIVALGVSGACAISYHFGTIVGAERVRDGVRAVQDAAPITLPLLEEVTGVQCRGCRKAVGACTCPKVLIQREGSA